MFTACIDIGGTFTDLILHEDGGGLEIFKSPTTPGAFHRGFLDVLALAAESRGLLLREFLAEIDLIVHGTTVSTNALVEGKTAPVGLLCTAGHPDVLTIREAPRKRAFNLKIDYPEPFVPRSRTCEIGGRIDAMGNEVAPLVEADVIAAVQHLQHCEVQAVAVALLWSIVNPAHELRIREILAEHWPDIPVTLSHELNPIPREYRRTIATAINSSLFPNVAAYTKALRDGLEEAGYRNELLIANCIGGMMPPDDIIARPIYSVMSGPTLAPIAASHLTDAPHVIVVDMGGTTFDVSALRDRQLVVSPEAMIGWDMLGIPKIDVRSVGAGGGSIAWIDSGGLLKVGPHSAGARPGPACYGLGGDRATVTDANVVLGLIDPDYFLGGRIKLDRKLAEAAVQRVADKLGTSLIDTAYAIYTTSNHNMIAAIEDITVNEGIDPRESELVCGGGATACHVGEMAQLLGIRRYMVPRFAAGFSALGGLMSDVRWEETATLQALHTEFPADAVASLLRRLRERGRAFLERSGFGAERQRFGYAFMGRYLYQSWDIEVPFELDADDGSVALDALVARFHATHERIYTIKDEADTVEFTTWKVRAIGDTGGSERRGTALSDQAGPVVPKSHRVTLTGRGAARADVPVIDGEKLGAGAVVGGPALIEMPTTTFLLPQGQTATCDRWGNLLVA